jgi:hypothetical protein
MGWRNPGISPRDRIGGYIMGSYYEGRAHCCYICKFFVQNSAEYRNGICVKHPPEKVDETLGAAVTGQPTGYKMFPNVLDSITGFCGKFELAPIIPADVAAPPPVYKNVT